MEGMKILQSDLQTRAATSDEKVEMDRRIAEDKPLFDDEPEGKKEPAKKEEGKPEEKTEDTLSDEQLLETDDKDLDDGQKARKSDLAKAGEAAEKQEEDERILNANDEDLDEGEKSRKAELVKEKEGAKSEEEKQKALDEEVKAYSTEHSVSEEDAKKDLESIGKIVDNFKGDAKKLAKTHLHMQRLQARTAEELKTLKNAPPPLPQEKETMAGIIEAIDEGKMTVDNKKASRGDIAEAYRKENPDMGEIDDDTAIKFVAKQMISNFAANAKENLAKLSVEAKEKKAKLIGELSESDKKFLPGIKPIIDNHTDSQIMSENYGLEDAILWEKGKGFETAVKDAEDKGFKRGIEARKIVGEIKKPGEGKAKTKKTGGKGSLTDAEKKKAEEYFANDDIPLATKHAHYADMLENDKRLEEAAKENDKDK